MNNPDPPQNQHPPPGEKAGATERREMYGEIAALIGALRAGVDHAGAGILVW